MSAPPIDNRAVYSRIATVFDEERSKALFERAWLDRFTRFLSDGAHILDLGCGSGEPIAAHLIAAGYRITGVDFATPMLDMARSRFPHQRWIEADMRDLDLGQTFDGVISWHGFFHLDPDAQRAALPRMVAHLANGGPLMLTVGPAEGETTGTVGGETVTHSSLSEQEYRERLSALGAPVCQFVRNDPDCGGATVCMAIRDAPSD